MLRPRIATPSVADHSTIALALVAKEAVALVLSDYCSVGSEPTIFCNELFGRVEFRGLQA